MEWLLETQGFEEVFQGSSKVGFEFHLLKCILQFLADSQEVYSSALVLNARLWTFPYVIVDG